MENPTLEIQCRIIARIPTGIHRFDGNSHKIRSDSYRIRVGPVVGLNLPGTYNGGPAQLTTWLTETSAFIAKEGYSETDHPFIIRHQLIDDTLDYYLAHEDIIFNFYDLPQSDKHQEKRINTRRNFNEKNFVKSAPFYDFFFVKVS